MNFRYYFSGTIITISILIAIPTYGLFQAVEKITETTTKATEKVTGAIIPPAEKIVEVPAEVARRTVSGVADIFRGPTLQITNKENNTLRVEIRREDNTLAYKTDLAQDQTMTPLKYIPQVVVLSYPKVEKSTVGLSFTREDFTDRSIALNATFTEGTLLLRPQGDKERNITREEIEEAKEKYETWIEGE